MIHAAKRLEKIISEASPKFLSYSETEASVKPAPNKWSKKEILGHLIDSASNNHQRFVRMQIENNLQLPQYKQNEWVTSQNYQGRKWYNVVHLWETYNIHLLHLLKNLDESKLKNTATFPEYGIKTLQFLIDDYVDHMEHHLAQVFR